MVVLSLSSRGNTARFFPHAGYLGLTPVIVQGVVLIRLQEDLRPVKASSVVVRVVCYESQVDGKPGRNENVSILYEAAQELWRKDENEEWGSLGEWDSFFRIVLPTSAGGVSTASFRSYRAWWQVEAVVTHKRIAMQGTTKIVAKPLLLTRYDVPHLPPPINFVPHTHTFHRGIECSIESTRYTASHDEPHTVIIAMRRQDPSVIVKKIAVSIERHHALCFDSLSSHNRDLKTVRPHMDELQFSTKSERYRTLNAELLSGRHCVYRSQDTSYFSRDSSRLNKRPTMTTFSPVCNENPSFDDNGNSQTSLVVTLPKSKSAYVYSIGETMCTRFSEIFFSIHVKIFIKSKPGGNESIDLSRELVVSPIGASERKRASQNALRQLPACQAEKDLFDRQSLTPPPDIPRPSTTADLAIHRSISRKASETFTINNEPNTAASPSRCHHSPSLSSKARNHPYGSTRRPRSAGGPSSHSSKETLRTLRGSTAPSSNSGGNNWRNRIPSDNSYYSSSSTTLQSTPSFSEPLPTPQESDSPETAGSIETSFSGLGVSYQAFAFASHASFHSESDVDMKELGSGQRRSISKTRSEPTTPHYPTDSSESVPLPNCASSLPTPPASRGAISPPLRCDDLQAELASKVPKTLRRKGLFGSLTTNSDDEASTRSGKWNPFIRRSSARS